MSIEEHHKIFSIPYILDNTLIPILGNKPMNRVNIIKGIWQYIKDNKLQDPKERRDILPDKQLKKVFNGNRRVSMFEMAKFINTHLTLPPLEDKPKRKYNKMSKCKICQKNITANDVTDGEVLFQKLDTENKLYIHTSCAANLTKNNANSYIEINAGKIGGKEYPKVKFLYNKISDDEVYFPINIPLVKEKVEKPMVVKSIIHTGGPQLIKSERRKDFTAEDYQKVEDNVKKVTEQKMKNYDLKVIQEELDKEVSIRLKGVLKKRTESYSEFLEKFFTKWNDEKPTIYVNNKHIQTEPSKRRSIGDVYRVVKYYYPNITLKEVSDWLYNNDVPNFRSSKCSQIKKRVFYYEEGSEKKIMEKTTNDEYGLTVKDWTHE